MSDVAVPEKPGAKKKPAKGGAATPAAAGGAAASKTLAAPDASILFPKDGKGIPIAKGASGASRSACDLSLDLGVLQFFFTQVLLLACAFRPL